MRIFALFLLSLFLFYCTDPAGQPSYVVEQYVTLINQGDIEGAKAYCTEARKAYLTALGDVMESADSHPDSSQIIIEDINCRAIDNGMLCQTIERDSFAAVHVNYYLAEIEGKWFIDQPAIEGKIEHSKKTASPEEQEQLDKQKKEE